MKVEDIKNVCIVGAGTMGQQISVPCIINGYAVTIYDKEKKQLEIARKRIEKILHGFTKMNKIKENEVEESLKRLKFTSDIKAAAENADIISESIPEDPELKGNVFNNLNDICKKETIFTTNTSTLLPSMMAEATGRPDKFIALHFHDVRITSIVDVMPHSGTSQETINLTAAFAEKIGQSAIVLKKESPGYVFNAMLSALFKAAHTLAANDVASVEDIDRAWMGVTHMFSGPFGIMDSIGIDTVWKVTNFWAEKLNDPQGKKNAAFLKEYVEKGDLGQKSEKGFYSYPEPAYRKPEFLK